MLERMLSAHSLVQGGPEPHLITPLAHLGVWAKVDKAPYDHILAAEAQKLFVAQLPGKEQDYWDACRAYCDILYGRFLHAKEGKRICLDKTPAYALVLPFLTRIYPDAAYVVLTRHPLAIFSSFADSFFDGEYLSAWKFNPIIERYVPAIAAFLRTGSSNAVHVRYEDLVSNPEEWFKNICNAIGIPYEPAAINYGSAGETDTRKGLGDPLGVSRHSRPSTASLDKWAAAFAGSPERLSLAKKMIEAVAPEDLATFGYPIDALWKPLEEAGPDVPLPKPPRLNRYRIERRLILRLRARAQQGGALRRLLEKIRLACDVLLRER